MSKKQKKKNWKRKKKKTVVNHKSVDKDEIKKIQDELNILTGDPSAKKTLDTILKEIDLDEPASIKNLQKLLDAMNVNPWLVELFTKHDGAEIKKQFLSLNSNVDLNMLSNEPNTKDTKDFAVGNKKIPVFLSSLEDSNELNETPYEKLKNLMGMIHTDSMSKQAVKNPKNKVKREFINDKKRTADNQDRLLVTKMKPVKNNKKTVQKDSETKDEDGITQKTQIKVDKAELEALLARTNYKNQFGDEKFYSEKSEAFFVNLKNGPSTSLFKGIENEDVNHHHMLTLHELESLKSWKEFVDSIFPPNNYERDVREIERQWKYPVDNEQDISFNEEFSDHVFLDQYLREFPDVDSIQKYMELVIHGLQQNPYLSAEEKIDKIMWHKDYFENFPDEEISASG